MLSLHQLRTFLEVARAGSVRAAAEHLVVSQPAISAALAALQRDLGVDLVERRGRGLALTGAGREVEGLGRRLFGLVEELEQRARAAGRQGAGWLRLGVTTTAAEHLVPLLLVAFRERYPAIAVELDVANRDRLWDRLAHGEIDLAIGGRPPLDREFTSLAVSPNELVVVAAPGMPADFATLARATWLLREDGSGTRGAMEEFLARLDAAPPRLTVGSNAAIRECVRVGLGVSLLPHDAVERDVAAGALAIVPTPFTPIARPWHLVCAASERPSGATERFVEHARATYFAASSSDVASRTACPTAALPSASSSSSSSARRSRSTRS
jgi:DNA-binding transcriptional LysR family regulator